MKAIVRMPATAVNEVSMDTFVKLCVTFQQAKQAISQHLNGADVTACDTVSRAVYNLANKAMSRNQRNNGKTVSAVRRGERLPLHEAIVQAVRKKDTFDSQAVIDAMKRKGTLPKAENVKAYISSVLSTRTELFKRVDRGTYRLKSKLVFAKKPPKQLPAATA